MFEKLLTNLPFDHGLVGQVSFYSRRMRQEASIRRTGIIFIVLAFMIQFFAVLSPPQNTSASPNNDMLSGGFSSPQDAAVKCHNNVNNYKDILNYYGIYCGDLNVGSDHIVNLGSASNGGQLYSMGYDPQGQHNAVTGRATNESPVNIPGVPRTLYVRLLYSFGTTTYQALRVTSQTGKAYWLLFGCGNLVSVGLPQPQPVQEGIGGNQPVSQPQPQPQPQPSQPAPTPTATPAPTPTPSATPTPCQYDNSITADNPSCKPCDDSVSSSDTTACVSIHKTASNITAGISNANNTRAGPGDVIVYTLYAKNNGKADVKDYVFEESLDDVLVYAKAVDLHGGSLDDHNSVTWPSLDIKAGETATEQVTVKVKDPVPQTPVGKDDPSHFDLVMTNVFGNTVNIRLPGSAQKTVETTASTLPNTGPGTTMLIGAAVIIVAGYFYGRARLLSKESILALEANGGS